MKQLVCIVQADDSRWTQWNLAPLFRFIRNPGVTVVTIFFRKIETKKEEKKLMWANEDEEESANIAKRELLAEKRSSISLKKGKTQSNDSLSSLSTVADGRIVKGAKQRKGEFVVSKFLEYTNHFGVKIVFSVGGGNPLRRPDVKDGERLVVVNEVLPNDSLDMFFFVKVKAVLLTKENFFEDCLFGNIPGGTISSLQGLMTHVFTPMFYQPNVLPESK